MTKKKTAASPIAAVIITLIAMAAFGLALSFVVDKILATSILMITGM